MPQRSLWKLLLISFFALLIAACNPIASFSVSPTPVKTGIEATFDASSTMVDVLPKGNKAKSYAWDFGDGSTGSGIATKHTYATAGTFKVKLVVVDSNGRKGNTTENIVVTAGDVVVVPATTPLKVITQIAGGVALTGAEVSAGAASAISDAQGLATLSAAPVGENQVITVKKAGYVTQSVRTTLTKDSEAQQLLVLLMPEKDTLSIAHIEVAQTIQSNYLGASVTLPANAMVDASTGVAATGAATLKFTPWNISGIDLQAMPGNGRALDASGNLVDLISAGMMTVDFFDAAGNKLQMAAGKSATIQMDLPSGTTSIGGNAVAVGTSIPLWHFAEKQGLWIEEGVGSVVSLPTGPAVSATVTHFSSWNWDFPMANTNPMNVSCADASGALIACNVTATVTLNDNSIFTLTSALPANVTRLLKIPKGAQVNWKAIDASGLVGTATSGTSGDVVIQLRQPTTSNFVRCLLPAGTGVACNVTLKAMLTDGTQATVAQYVPPEGAPIVTSLNTSGEMEWYAISLFAMDQNNELLRSAGSATSGTTESVNIELSLTVAAPGKTLLFGCESQAQIKNSAGSISMENIATCNINISFIPDVHNVDTLPPTVYVFRDISAGSKVAIKVPFSTDLYSSVQAHAKSVTLETGTTVQAEAYISPDSYSDNQVTMMTLRSPLY